MYNKLNIQFITGLFICASVGWVAITLADQLTWLVSYGLSTLTIAILLGIALGNLPVLAQPIHQYIAGIAFTKQRILRLGIVLYGFKLTVQDIGNVGILGAVIDSLVFLSTFFLAVYLGIKYFKLDRNLAIMIGAGSAICGAAAVLATQPVVKAENDKVTVAISTVVIFGTVSIFAYPALYQMSQSFFLHSQFPMQFGIYIGSTVHEVAQVLAAAKSVGDRVADTAVITKMMRVMMLGPFLIVLAIYLGVMASRQARSQSAEQDQISGWRVAQTSIPWFAFLFLLVIGFNSMELLSSSVKTAIIDIDNFLLASAMAALGLTTHFSAIKKAGFKPFLLAFIVFLWLVFGGGLINILATVWWGL